MYGFLSGMNASRACAFDRAAQTVAEQACGWCNRPRRLSSTYF
jgi:hypothetical protein